MVVMLGLVSKKFLKLILLNSHVTETFNHKRYTYIE